ncbi:MAG: RluA family pseudouridine synthase [Planctomycetes bacterium]|nr:RluA family pseudouridine synthase [Planctomycetota bacterium]
MDRRELRFTASRKDKNLKIEHAITARHQELPLGLVLRLLKDGCVSASGREVAKHEIVSEGETYVVRIPEDVTLIRPNPDVPFDVIFEHADFLAIYKPAGVVSAPGRGHALDTLLNGIASRYGAEVERLGPNFDYGMVHRLDKDTSGLMVYARNPETHERFREMFASGRIERTYLALVHGVPQKRVGEIDVPLGEEVRGSRNVVVTSGPNAKPARTLYEVIAGDGTNALLKVTPMTGRWRQIREHLKIIGHPIAGDDDDSIRLMLHAWKLRWFDTALKKEFAFESEPPGEFDS